MCANSMIDDLFVKCLKIIVRWEGVAAFAVKIILAVRSVARLDRNAIDPGT